MTNKNPEIMPTYDFKAVNDETTVASIHHKPQSLKGGDGIESMNHGSFETKKQAKAAIINSPLLGIDHK